MQKNLDYSALRCQKVSMERYQKEAIINDIEGIVFITPLKRKRFSQVRHNELKFL